LGPIFVKFGQMLSTRRDMIPADIAEELARLQDRVPPFPSDQALAVIEAGFYGRNAADTVFAEFEQHADRLRLRGPGAFRARLPERRPPWRSRCCVRASRRVIGHDLSSSCDVAWPVLHRAPVVGRQAASSRGRW
jgi:hypothetical protein